MDINAQNSGEELQPDILMVDPKFFEVDYEINPYMDEEVEVDSEEARNQHEELVKKYRDELGLDVHVVDPVEGLPDMVFAANHGFAYKDSGKVKVLPAKMEHEEREDEVEPVMRELEELGFEVLEQPEYVFEGSGDAMQHPEQGKIWVGHGQRTEGEAVERIQETTGLETVGVELETEHFYHLDTCFEHLDKDTALVNPEAINEEDLSKIEDVYEKTIEVAPDEADKMAGNAHCPDGKNIIIHEEAEKTANELDSKGYNVITTDTSEYLKSGGSVYCMKLQLSDLTTKKAEQTLH